MHFWIDKRSQACGFGRARVSASLSGAGSGFAHPPRRISGHKSSSSSTTSSHPSVHRQQQHTQQHHHNHHQHQQQHQQQQIARTSSAVITTTADCHARNSHQHGIINNNNVANNSSSSNIHVQQHQPQRIIQQQLQQQHIYTHNMNNNAHLPLQQQQQQQQQQQGNNCPLNVANNGITINTTTYNMLNNNNNNTSNVTTTTNNISGNSTTNPSTNALLPATTSATNTATSSATTTTVLHAGAAGAVVPVATNVYFGGSGGFRYGRQPYRSSQQYPTTITMGNQSNAVASNHHYDTRSYHHPQFGNMSVRHYQYATAGNNNGSNGGNQANIPCINAASTSLSPLRQMQQVNVRAATAIGNPHPQFSAVATQSGHLSGHVTSSVIHEYRGGNVTGGCMQQQQRQLSHSQHSLHHVCGGIDHAEDLDMGNTMVLGPLHTRPMHSHHVGPQQRNISNGNMRATITHNGMIDDAETQPMLAQLKCGMWASLIMASIFVAGAKFYFDNQGTGLEVIIFCAFSATFFLAACTVSLCRLPKGLVTARHMDGNQRGLLTGGNQSGGHGPASNTGGNNHQLFGQSNDQRLHELQERTAAAQAGPPPYHIAILLPENSKEVAAAVSDESPPPSYDKILI